MPSLRSYLRFADRAFRRLAVIRRRLGISFSLILFSFYLLLTISLFSFQDAREFQSKPAVDVGIYNNAADYYDRAGELVDGYRRLWDEDARSKYSPPEPTEILFNIERAYDIDEIRNTISLEGDITATWIDSSVRDYEDLGSSPELDLARQDILSQSVLNFTDADNQIFEKIWEYKYVMDESVLGPEYAGETMYRVQYRFHGSFPLEQNYQKFPFDNAVIVLRIISKIEAPNVYYFADEESVNSDGLYRVNSFLYSKQTCVEGEEAFYSCVSDDIKFGGIYDLSDDLDEFSDQELKEFYYDAVSAEASAATYHFLQRSPGTSFFRYLLPLAISIFVVAIVDQLDIASWEIKLATPPTILLTLIFMQSGYQSSFAQISYLTFMDKIYLLAYLLTLLALVRAILEKRRHKLLFRRASTKNLARIISILRSLFLFGATVAPFLIYKFS